MNGHMNTDRSAAAGLARAASVVRDVLADITLERQEEAVLVRG